MKQVVVAVLDADGAYGWYKKIIAYVLLPEDKDKVEVTINESRAV